MILRWSARLLSLVCTGLLFSFLFGGAEHINFTTKEFIAVLFFPYGLIIGFAIAWFRPRLGSLISLGSLAGFYVWMLIASGSFPGGPYFLLFALPAILFYFVDRKPRSSQ
jgi:hypothetical protein